MRAVCSAVALDYPSDRYEIIVVDNASTDATPQEIKNLQGDVNRHILRYVSEERLGLHNARHAGARAANGEILVFTDDDATFDPGWLQSYAQHLRNILTWLRPAVPCDRCMIHRRPNGYLITSVGKKYAPS